MLKVTLIFALFIFCACGDSSSTDELDAYEIQINQQAEKKIDAAYIQITKHCDSLFTYELPRKVDSILKSKK